MKFYYVRKQYLKYLNGLDTHIINNVQIIGFPLRINKRGYFIPISLSKKEDPQKNHHQQFLECMIFIEINIMENVYF
ncbi:hypothetical protein C7U54_01065 [Faecalibacillus intestinalis]|uniref:Uncharacterized protein n=1 Tax=Faecalibacillus intestinalis TaxID=1982626 RepID=A0A2T3G702_9FIRM|nr:type III toxin-antitoxin system ToxN/AbiQ family toxin [Faecalibacillus intestinalis]PST43330.1 hypothetical protein C7U54_01065 [Faecalibacillus intestinalis]